MKLIWKICIGLLVVAGMSACDEDEDTQSPVLQTVKLQFEDLSDINENDDPVEVKILLDKKAPKAGSVKIELTSELVNAFETTPVIEEGFIELTIDQGDEAVAFIITPLDNTILDLERNIDFEIAAVSEGFAIGTKKQLNISIIDDEAPVLVNLVGTSASFVETDTEGITVTVSFSAPAPGAGKIILQPNGGITDIVATTPDLNSNNKLVLDVTAGANEVSFSLNALYNNKLVGHKDLSFEILQVEGPFQLGESLTFDLTILDVELMGLPKYYETISGVWRVKKTYEYNENGKIARVHWERETPALQTGTDTYYYNENGQIERINHHAYRDTYYYYENGKVNRSEVIRDGEMTDYSLYDYDPAGNLGGQANYHKQSDGSFLPGIMSIYLFFETGNIYKHLLYSKSGDDYDLVSTRTYDDYIGNTQCAFPMVEVIPNIKMQYELPATYVLEESGNTTTYNMYYSIDDNGRLTSRSVNGAGTAEETTYGYY